MSTDSPFDQVPSGIDLAKYFWLVTDRRNEGCDGISLYRDGNDYCHLWVTSVVDHDMYVSYLLDVRTNTDGIETRDFLFVHAGANSRFEVEWRQRPTLFEDDSRARRYDGMQWFVERDDQAMEENS